jgi:hypothetical protein
MTSGLIRNTAHSSRSEEFPEHQLSDPVYLLRIGDGRCLAPTDRLRISSQLVKGRLTASDTLAQRAILLAS